MRPTAVQVMPEETRLSKSNPLNVFAGSQALSHIREFGLNLSDVSIVLGASSGPKWLVLQALDQYLLRAFKDHARVINTLGTSAGAWRMASYAHPDNLAAHDSLTDAYIHQRYSQKPSPAEILQGCRGVLGQMLGGVNEGALLSHPTYHLNLIVTQCRGLSGMDNRQLNLMGFGLAALANKVSRRTLGSQFTRVLMRHPEGGLLHSPLKDLPTRYISLSEDNVKNALLATGSIPIVIEGIKDLAGKGVFQDGGITDYAFDLPLLPEDGFVLFPHFSKFPIPGWFDKAWVSKRKPWRRPKTSNYERTIMLVPSDDFVQSLPFQKIPDRHDFLKMDDLTRINTWKQVVDQSQQLAEALDSTHWQTEAKALPW